MNCPPCIARVLWETQGRPSPFDRGQAEDRQANRSHSDWTDIPPTRQLNNCFHWHAEAGVTVVVDHRARRSVHNAMVNVVLIVVGAIVPFVLLFMNFVLLARYIDPAHAKGHWISKGIIVRQGLSRK